MIRLPLSLTIRSKADINAGGRPSEVQGTRCRGPGSDPSISALVTDDGHAEADLAS